MTDLDCYGNVILRQAQDDKTDISFFSCYMNFLKLYWQKGYIAISSVLVISFVTLALTTSVALLSIGESQSSLALVKGEGTLQFVEGCVEDGLIKSRVNSSYSGGAIARPEGTCSITVSKAGNVWTMTATTTNTAYARTMQVVFTRNSNGITLTTWKEI